MSPKVYLTIRGAKQGTFKGGSPHHDDWIEVLSFTYSVESPRDASSGQASGKRQHSPIKIVKEWGASSPQFLQALATNEVLKSVSLRFVKPDHDGRESIYHTIKLTNGSVMSIQRSHGPSGKLLEEVALAFESSSSNAASQIMFRHATLVGHAA